MRQGQKRTRQMEISHLALLMSLVLSLVVFSGLSLAETHSGHTAEFTLNNLIAKPTGEFSLKRLVNTQYPLSIAERDVAIPRIPIKCTESTPSRSSSGTREKTKDRQDIALIRPPLNQAKVVGEFMVGSVLGMATGLGAAYIGARISYDGSWFSEWPGAMIGFTLAYPLGCALGVYSVGNIGSTTGSFASALGAAYGGIIVGAIGAYALNRVSQTASAIVFLAAPPLLATFAFNKSRRYKNPPTVSASLLNFRGGKMNLGFPAILAFPSAPGSSKLDWLVNLASLEF